MNNRSGHLSKFSFVLLLFLACSLVAQETPRTTQLPNGKLLADVPGNPRPINNLPTAVSISPDGHFAVLLHSGFGSYTSERNNLFPFSIFETDDSPTGRTIGSAAKLVKRISWGWLQPGWQTRFCFHGFAHRSTGQAEK